MQEKRYKILENRAEIKINKTIYHLEAIKKALSNFFDVAFLILDEDDKDIIISLELKNNVEDLQNIVKEFYNELLRESIRYDISKETKNIRELILARALYTTCIDTEEYVDDGEIEEDYDLETIAVNWFDKE